MKTKLTIPQSKTLVKLGIDEALRSEVDYHDPYDLDDAIEESVFSLTDLLSILPKKITDRSKIYEVKMWVDHYSDAWCIEYENIHECSDVLDSCQSGAELCDAIFNTIVWLKEAPVLVWL